MAVIQSPDQREELKNVDEILLQELQRVDEILLQELERVRTRYSYGLWAQSTSCRSESPPPVGGSSSGPSQATGLRAEPQGSRAFTRPFNPYDEDEDEAVEVKESAVSQVASRVQSWLAAYAPEREALVFASLSLVVALLATAIAVVALIVAALVVVRECAQPHD